MTGSASCVGTTDLILGGRVALRQPEAGYRVAIDPIFLAAVIDNSVTGHLLDAGCGSGAALFCALIRNPDLSGTGVELDETLARYAQDGVAENDLAGRATIRCSDITVLSAVNEASVDAIITNPPYYKEGSVPPLPVGDRTHSESSVSLESWIKACLRPLRQDGLFAIVHRAERVSEVIAALNKRSGDINIVPLWPKAGQPAKRVIVTARKGRRTPATIQPGIVLHEENGRFTRPASAVLEDGASLSAVT